MSTSTNLASVMDSDIVLSMLYHRAPMAADAGIPLHTSDAATLRRALRASPLLATPSAPPMPFLPGRDTFSSLSTRRSSIRGVPSAVAAAPVRPLPSPYARYDRKYAEGDYTHRSNTEFNIFPGFDAAMGDYALPENMAKRWMRQGACLGHKLSARVRQHTLARNVNEAAPRPRFTPDD